MRLVALCASRRTGREVAEQWEIEVGEPLGNGTLYTTLSRLAERGLMTKSRGADDRSRSFVATPAGRAALSLTRRHYLALVRFATVPA